MARGEHSAEERAHRQNCRYYVACPQCGAEAGEKCIGVRGQRRAANHVERWQLFDPAHIAAKTTRTKKPRAKVVKPRRRLADEFKPIKD